MFRTSVILACVLFLLAGCKTAPHEKAKRSSAKEYPPDWELVPKERPSPQPAIITPPQEPITTVESTMVSPENQWLPLNRWSQEHGLGNLRRMSASPLESFALPSTNGTLMVTAGNLTAYWRGLAMRLGFAPRMIDGQISINALDGRKNFVPLLFGHPFLTGTNRVIVIDPGHGGSNTGTRSVVDGRWEKEFTLDWARRLAPLLEEEGWTVYLTRANDVDMSLADRVAFAERQQAGAFLSLHFNSAPVGQHEQSGLETYCLTPVGMPSTLTRDSGEDTLQVFPNNAYDEQNLLFALRLHHALLEVNGAADRGVRRARFPGVLRGQRRPAVLIEGGYLSNHEEAQRIGDPVHRQKLAEAIAKALE